MPYPSLERYNLAFALHSTLLTDPDLKGGAVEKTGLGSPLAISGGFALTYTITTAGARKFAVRCFHREAKGLERRYAAISKRLAALRSPYFVDFQFQQPGIKVDGAGYPIVKMSWAAGETLGEFLEKCHGDKGSLEKLSRSITSLADFFEREQIAHGDLQPGNLMVSAGGSAIQLIDYDGMYVDEIKDIGSAELGHINFQHPQRKLANPFNPRLDRFSLIALSVALKAVQLDPAIWYQSKSEVDAIVFRANDFIDPESSEVFALLSANPALNVDATNFAAICKSPMDKVPNLRDFVAGKNIPATSILFAGKRLAGAPQLGYASQYGVVSATDYKRCLSSVSDRVEVVGRITEVNPKTTKKGAPYIFINFGDWRGNIFKISIWSSSLATFKNKPDSSWVGKWISVVGMMEPPHPAKGNYMHLSISIINANQIAFITDVEARWRLASPASHARSAATGSNMDALAKINDHHATRPPKSTAPMKSNVISANQAALDKIKAASIQNQRTPTPMQPRPPAPSSVQPRAAPRPAQQWAAAKPAIHSRSPHQQAATTRNGVAPGLLQRIIRFLFR